MKKDSLTKKSLIMTYHFTLDVTFWYDKEYSFCIPEYLKVVKSVDRDFYSCKELYMSKRYDSLSAMMEDFNAVEMSELGTTPTFYNNDKRLTT